MRAARAVAACLVLAGCRSIPTTGPAPPTSRVFEAPSSRVWDAAVAALERERYRLSSVNQASGALLAERDDPGRAVRELAREPSARLDNRWWGLGVTLTLAIEDVAPSQTRVTVRSRLEGKTSPLTPQARRLRPPIVPLTSNGTLERQCLDAIALWLAKKANVP